MPIRTLTDAAGAPAALAAFLRGVERRGAVFAELQCGNAAHGDDALIVTMRAFHTVAAHHPIAQWPQKFWALLLGSPVFWQRLHPGHWPSELMTLSALGDGPRAALLLRLVAGLSETDCAAALGVSVSIYRLALQRALPRRPDGGPDDASWRALAQATRQAMRNLPAERLTHLARVRESSLQTQSLTGQPFEIAIPSQMRWRGPALAITAACIVIAFAATFLNSGRYDLKNGRIRISPLPQADQPAATYDAQIAVLTHRDFEMLADGDRNPAVQDPAFYAWLAARTDARREKDQADPLPMADAESSLREKPVDAP